MELVAFGALAAILGLAAGFAGGVFVLHRSGPVASSKALAELARVRLEWEAWRTGAEGVLEAIEEVSETVERKRRRVAARESEEKKRQEAGNGAAMDKASLRARARALGVDL